MSSDVKIQTSITGFRGKPVTVFSLYNTDAEMLVIAKLADFSRERRSGCVVVTNYHAQDMPRDMFVNEDHFQDAIRAYFAMYNGMVRGAAVSRFKLADGMNLCNPSAAIEKDGVDERGRDRYRVAEITNHQAAALFTCLYASRAGGISRTVDAVSRFTSILRGGGVITV